MRDSAVHLLACPECGDGLYLGVDERAPDGHVMVGALRCGGCDGVFPITGGVPRLLPAGVEPAAERTAARFGEQWKTFDHMAEYQEAWLRDWLTPLGPDDFRGRSVLEAGCGKGRHTVVVADWGAHDIVALDLSESVDVAFAHTRDRFNVHVVQGDILHPPVQRLFDMVFSVGVLHHLPVPRAGFERLRSLVVPGGTIAVWVYGHEGNEWLVKLVSPVRETITARMPAELLYWMSLAPSAALAAGLTLYRSERLSERLPYREYLRRMATLPLREIHNIVFDQLVTPIAHYLPGDEVRSWFAGDGFARVTVARHNGMSWRASAVVTR